MPADNQFLLVYPHREYHQGAAVKPDLGPAQYLSNVMYIQYGTTCKVLNMLLDVNHVQGPPGQKGDQGATEIIDYNGNLQEALQVR